MIKFGISWVARLLGVSGFTVQQPTTRGSLQDLNISARVVPLIQTIWPMIISIFITIQSD